MKEWKSQLVEAIVEEAEKSRIISLRDVALEKGVNHIKTQEVMEITGSVLRRLPEYRAVRMMGTACDSLFVSLHFVEKTVEFLSEEDFIRDLTGGTEL